MVLSIHVRCPEKFILETLAPFFLTLHKEACFPLVKIKLLAGDGGSMVSAPGSLRQNYFDSETTLGMHSEFEATQSYMLRTCLKNELKKQIQVFLYDRKHMIGFF